MSLFSMDTEIEMQLDKDTTCSFKPLTFKQRADIMALIEGGKDNEAGKQLILCSLTKLKHKQVDVALEFEGNLLSEKTLDVLAANGLTNMISVGASEHLIKVKKEVSLKGYPEMKIIATRDTRTSEVEKKN